ncbi:SGNH family hydrolase [Pseudomonas protegens]|uniref:SGNH/GDSL hydrolase family protein n=1 Tax=Pseudomonas protegens TaxID=380021 RepID=UPI000F47BA7C|nr:SGNH family hydrolase [Pseudomonas protegens]ROL95874.1 GDSL family lipase [Pseudomonas protegens]ROM01769.1 GDSL family lipase [Pseudomonas protegens]ROM07295.1 GDSL family lipase [Pseudomonas protegens]ROM10477.1 GDSL family lipase [Pseudomonas protegens]
MPVSNRSPLSVSLGSAAKVFYALVVTSLLLVWFNQQSIRLYCQQKYHDDCEIPGLSQNPQWRFGAQLNQALENARVAFVGSFAATADLSLVAQAEAAADEEPAPLPKVAAAPAPEHPPLSAAHAAPTHTATQAPVPPPVHPQPVAVAPVVSHPPQVESGRTAPLMASLATGDEVFFVGDSLMQGVAPHMANTLRKRYNVKSLNLSKQSTGLAYPSFFNWPKTVESTLASNPNIRLMVIFLGPNDPWDMPVVKGKPFLRFKTPDWEAAYRQRIDSILDTAQAHNVQVIWVGPPNMEKPKLSTAMAYLSDLYKSQIERYQQHFVSANEILGYQNDEFSYYRTTGDGKKVKTRVDDGIHFTTTGQKLIAERVISLINFPSQQLTEH